MPDTHSGGGRRLSLGTPTSGNSFGIVEALFGLAAGFLLSALALSLYDSAAHVTSSQVTFGQDVVSLFALWTGFAGAAVVASRLRVAAPPTAVGIPGPARAEAVRRGAGSFLSDFGVRLRPFPDIPLGIAIGVAAQLLLVPLFELPLQPFVPHLAEKLGHPTKELLGPAQSGGTAELVVMALLVCVGSPVVEELFFRGLLLRGLLGRLSPLGSKLGPAVSVVVTGLVFALVHFEALEFLGLAVLGIVLSLLAWRSGRLGPSIVAHMAFNATAVIAYAFAH